MGADASRGAGIEVVIDMAGLTSIPGRLAGRMLGLV